MKHEAVINEHEKTFESMGARQHEIEQSIIKIKDEEITPMKVMLAGMKNDMDWIKWGVLLILAGTVIKTVVEWWIKR